MMAKKTLRAMLIAAPFWIAPAYLSAQDAPAATPAVEPSAAPASQAGTTVEQLSARITAIQQRALQDPELRAASAAMQTLIQQTMARIDTNYATYAARANTIKTDVAAAQAAQDNAKLHELAAEATQLQANIAALQARAREEQAVKEKLEEYTTKLFAKMVEIEPTVRELVSQLEALRAGGAAS